MTADGFLARWSRRKLGRRAPAKAAPEVAVPEPGSPSAEPRDPERERQAPEDASPPSGIGSPAELSPEDIAALPRIEDLTAETDLAPFLRRGVPALLRAAALRRVWALDPAIRDFVGEARDYSYDWNVPGGVPGFGPLSPPDDASAALGRMFSAPQASGWQDGPEPAVAPRPAAADIAEPASPACLHQASEPAAEPIQEGEQDRVEAPEARAEAQPRRKHGGAVPI